MKKPPPPIGYRQSRKGKWKPVWQLTGEQKQLRFEIQGVSTEIQLNAQRFAQSERDNEAKKTALETQCKHEVLRLEQSFLDETVFCCICGNAPSKMNDPLSMCNRPEE
jgi:hypothetical protein